MGKTAADTDRDMRRAMAVFKARVLDAKNFDPATATYLYEGTITETAIRKIAGVKSRGTLRPKYHEELRGELRALVRELKIQTGKISAEDSVDGDEAAPEKKNVSEISRSERLAQTIAALSFRIMVMEREIASLRAGDGAKTDNVAHLMSKRRMREGKNNGRIR
ncbi:hypothetical protein [Bosea sp. BIWAKO-01]|uniref:hypothetical protein n=1 Tax=Bosea sp. BIWAKO-01 TaxID=506668 RepID=UPI000852E680|nr:hypothetical protein [Bosea sp. BIWAKO-01]